MNDQNNQTEGNDPQEQQNEAAPGNSFADIADLLGHAADVDPGADNGQEEKKPEGVDPSQTPKDEAQPEGGKEGTNDQSQTPKPGEEQKPQSEAKPPEPSLKDVLKEVMNEVKAEAPKPQEQKPEEPKPEGPKYSPLVPDEIMAAIESEDPKVRQQGVSAMLGGAMNRVYADLKKEMQVTMATVLQQVPTILQQQQSAQAEAKRNHDTFYSENPNFGTSEARKRLVAQTAIMLAQSEGKAYKGFTPEFRTKLADQLQEMTGIPKGKAPQKEPAKETKPAKPNNGFQAGNSGARTGGGEKTLADEIMETIGSVIN
jgi:hypothetical protein